MHLADNFVLSISVVTTVEMQQVALSHLVLRYCKDNKCRNEKGTFNFLIASFSSALLSQLSKVKHVLLFQPALFFMQFSWCRQLGQCYQACEPWQLFHIWSHFYLCMFNLWCCIIIFAVYLVIFISYMIWRETKYGRYMDDKLPCPFGPCSGLRHQHMSWGNAVIFSVTLMWHSLVLCSAFVGVY